MYELEADAFKAWFVEVADSVDLLEAHNARTRLFNLFDNARPSEVKAQYSVGSVREFAPRGQPIGKHIVAHHM